MLSIQDFSVRTGVSKSAIRYYETMGLLNAEKRAENGYRIYSEDQISTVRLIVSLRTAGVAISDIKAYLTEDNDQIKAEMMNQWIQNAKEEIEKLTVSIHYLESGARPEQVGLINKNHEQVIWYDAKSALGDFQHHFESKLQELNHQDIKVKELYLKYLSGDQVIKVKMGFGILQNSSLHLCPDEYEVEQLPGGLYITLPISHTPEKIKEGYQQLIGYACANGWIPTGPALEWYRGNDFSTVNLIMPVISPGETKV